MTSESNASQTRTNPRSRADRERLYRQVGLALVVVGILVFNAWSEAQQARVQEQAKIAAAEQQAAEKARKAEEQAEAARRKAKATSKSPPSTTKSERPQPGTTATDVAASPTNRSGGAPVTASPPQPRDKPATGKSSTRPSEPRGPPVAGDPQQATPKTRSDPPTLFRNVTLKNQDGRVIYRGDIDVAPTLARIDRDQRLSQYRNDGITFQNREGRLPKKPSGHYREWVHPTPGVGGPGPQRIVTGKTGEAYYTHDHYDTFRKIR